MSCSATCLSPNGRAHLQHSLTKNPGRRSSELEINSRAEMKRRLKKRYEGFWLCLTLNRDIIYRNGISCESWASNLPPLKRSSFTAWWSKSVWIKAWTLSPPTQTTPRATSITAALPSSGRDRTIHSTQMWMRFSERGVLWLRKSARGKAQDQMRRITVR